MTGGLGMFTVEFSHYEEVPAQIAEKIVAARNAAYSLMTDTRMNRNRSVSPLLP